jgi:methanogenic corrinoid protein MtbC1
MNASRIRELIVDMDEAVGGEVKKALNAGEDPVDLLQNGIIRALEVIGQKFEEKEYFLAELMMGGEIAEQCIKLIEPHLPPREGPARGVVVIGAVRGDLHDIGYSLVAKQLKLAGFEVHEMGVNIPAMSFIDKAQEVNADIIGLSAFLVTTIPSCSEVIDYLRDMSLRDRFKVIIGGAETSQEKADELGADGWAENAGQAVALCRNLMGAEAEASA